MDKAMLRSILKVFSGLELEVMITVSTKFTEDGMCFREDGGKRMRSYR